MSVAPMTRRSAVSTSSAGFIVGFIRYEGIVFIVGDPLRTDQIQPHSTTILSHICRKTLAVTFITLNTFIFAKSPQTPLKQVLTLNFMQSPCCDVAYFVIIPPRFIELTLIMT